MPVKERIKTAFFTSWIFLPIYLTNKRGRFLVDDRNFAWEGGGVWALFWLHLIILFFATPFVEDKMSRNFKREYFGLIHALLLTVTLAFFYITMNGAHFFAKVVLIWVVGFFPYILQIGRK